MTLQNIWSAGNTIAEKVVLFFPETKDRRGRKQKLKVDLQDGTKGEREKEMKKERHTQ